VLFWKRAATMNHSQLTGKPPPPPPPILQSILHSDLKARNILLKSSASDSKGFVAKVCVCV